jgi:hypothetical protein
MCNAVARSLDIFSVSRSETTMVAVGLSPRDADKTYDPESRSDD